MSRLSTTAFSGRNASLEEIGAHLGADYVLSGAYRAANSHFKLDVELAETRSGRDRLGRDPGGRPVRHRERRAGTDRPADRRRRRRGDDARAAALALPAPADAQGLHAADGRRQPDASPLAARLRRGASLPAGAGRPRRAPSAAHRLARQLACAAHPAGLVRRPAARHLPRARSAPSARSTWTPTIRSRWRSTASCTSTS